MLFIKNGYILLKRKTSGEMVEWSKAPHWKCGDGQLSEGSNPSLSAIFFALVHERRKNHRKNYKSQDGKYDLLLRFFIFTFLLSAWRRKRDFLRVALRFSTAGLRCSRSSELRSAVESLSLRHFFCKKNGGMKPSGFASWHAVPLHAA